MTSPDPNARLLEDAIRPQPVTPRPSLLAPYRDALLTQRARRISYERITAALGRNGVQVSLSWVGIFCRKNFPPGEIARRRRELAANITPPAAPEIRPLPVPIANTGASR